MRCQAPAIRLLFLIGFSMVLIGVGQVFGIDPPPPPLTIPAPTGGINKCTGLFPACYCKDDFPYCDPTFQVCTARTDVNCVDGAITITSKAYKVMIRPILGNCAGSGLESAYRDPCKRYSSIGCASTYEYENTACSDAIPCRMIWYSTSPAAYWPDCS